MNIDSLRRQHTEIAKVMQDMEGLLKLPLENKAFELSLKLGELAGKLTFHLQSEDKFLYPSLLSSSDPKIKKIGQEFVNEMGGIAQVFTGYREKYKSAANIKANPQEFMATTGQVFAVLKKRVAAEEQKLYPLLKV